eukprot:TRINITY_DN34798_c0_g1_i1.p1 TRINITY_DN34798_c0_g1~~TRINITY_DN34798_c0_g1_i1.p1  ORF type:complete len:515 (-),score=76.72 TRINITY_DN34798_c0_g1_i1:422-1966(-)
MPSATGFGSHGNSRISRSAGAIGYGCPSASNSAAALAAEEFRRCGTSSETASVLDRISVSGAPVPKRGIAASSKHTLLTSMNKQSKERRAVSQGIAPEAWLTSDAIPGRAPDCFVHEGRRYAGSVSHEPQRPSRENSLLSATTYSTTFVDHSDAREIAKPPPTIYDAKRGQDFLAAATGCDPRRIAAEALNRARCGETEQRKEYRKWTPQELASAKTISPAMEENRRAVEDVLRRVRARKAAAAKGQRAQRRRAKERLPDFDHETDRASQSTACSQASAVSMPSAKPPPLAMDLSELRRMILQEDDDIPEDATMETVEEDELAAYHGQMPPSPALLTERSNLSTTTTSSRTRPRSAGAVLGVAAGGLSSSWGDRAANESEVSNVQRVVRNRPHSAVSVARTSTNGFARIDEDEFDAMSCSAATVLSACTVDVPSLTGAVASMRPRSASLLQHSDGINGSVVSTACSSMISRASARQRPASAGSGFGGSTQVRTAAYVARRSLAQHRGVGLEMGG